VKLSPLERGRGVLKLKMKRKIIPYNPAPKQLARDLRNRSTKAEIFLWQKPVDNYILDFFCYELMPGIEVDGYSHEFLEVYNKDVVKEAEMNEFGITVLRFSDYQVMKIWKTCSERLSNI
jgi:very-short-patch-repair endonuclease